MFPVQSALHYSGCGRDLHDAAAIALLVLPRCVPQGRLYPDMLLCDDLSVDIIPQGLTNTSYTGGYSIVSRCKQGP